MTRLWLVSVLAIALLAACAGGAGEGSKDDASRLSDATFVFEVDPGVEEGDREIIERLLGQVRTFYSRDTGYDIQHDVTVQVKDGDTKTGKTAYGTYGRIEIYTDAPAWTQARYKGAEAANAALVAHEYFHTLQWDLVVGKGSPNRRFSIPAAWLVEGSAELAAYEFTEQAGYVTMQNAIDYYSGFIAGTPQPRLGTVVVNSQANYAQAFLAVERLSRDHDLRTFLTFFRDSGSINWRDAYARNFGENVETTIDRLEDEPGAMMP